MGEVGDPLDVQQILRHGPPDMVRRYVWMPNVQRSLIDRRSSPMDLLAGSQQPSRNSRRVQAKKPRILRGE